VSVTVGPGTNKVDNRAPWALGGANFVEFVPAGSVPTIVGTGGSAVTHSYEAAVN